VYVVGYIIIIKVSPIYSQIVGKNVISDDTIIDKSLKYITGKYNFTTFLHFHIKRLVQYLICFSFRSVQLAFIVIL